MTKTAHTIRLFLVLLGTLVFALTLPGLYRKAFEKRPDKKLIYYSEISHDFLISETTTNPQTGETAMTYRDRHGKEYTEREYNRLLPFLHTRKLALLNELPDSIDGIPFTRDLLKTTRRGMLMPEYSFRFQLNPLFESALGKVYVEQPDDLFRINTHGIQFLAPATNRLLPEKSRLFNDALTAKGFQAPARAIYGIPSTLKSRDDGYFIIDNTNHLYHLKMVKGVLYCRHIPTDIDISYMKCQVPGDLYAYLYDRSGQLYVLLTDYTLKPLPIRPGNGRFILSGNCFYKTFKNTDTDSTRLYVLSPSYDLVDYHAIPSDNYAHSRTAAIERHLFPFRLMLTPGYAHLIPLPNPIGQFLWLNIALTLLLSAIKRLHRRKLTAPFHLADLGLTLVFGIYGFLSVLIFSNRGS